MGITIDSARFMIAAKKAGVNFSETLTLGHQWLFASPKQLNACLETIGIRSTLQSHTWADDFLNALGSKKLVILDNSPYEGATIIQDLNTSIPAHMHNSFDFIYDGGTLEHVYNFPVAVENCMNLCRVGGHVCHWTPANNECGHGFYQFSPELFYRLYSQHNGFRLISIVFVEVGILATRWYEVVDPAKINARVCCVNRHPVFMMVLAQKIREIVPSEMSVLQADYVESWGIVDQAKANTRMTSSSPRIRVKDRLKKGLKQFSPRFSSWLTNFYSTYLVRRLNNRVFYKHVMPEQFEVHP